MGMMLDQRLRTYIRDVEHLRVENVTPESNCASPVETCAAGVHLKLQIVSDTFEGMRPLDRQRLVFQALQAELDSGAIHSLAQLQTITTAQWRERAKHGHLAWVDERIRGAIAGIDHLDIRDVTNGHT